MNLTFRKILPVIVVLSTLVVKGTCGASDYLIRFDDHGKLLTVHVEKMALGALLKAVEKESGIRFKLNQALQETEVSANLNSLPLLSGIKKIIDPLSFAVMYDGDGRINEVIVYDSGKRDNIMESQKTIKKTFKAARLELPDGPPIKKTEDTDSSLKNKGPSLGNESTCLDKGPPATETTSADDGPPDLPDEELSGPPDQQVADHPPPGIF